MTLQQTTTAPDLAPGLEKVFAHPAEEAAYEIDSIRGQLPRWLRGTYYANGPANFQVGDIGYRHWLDGDGMALALRLSADGVRFCSRYVRTRKREQEQSAGRALFRTFGTAFPGDSLRRNLMLEPPVNVSILPFAGTILALGEQSLPVAMDPETLESRGEYDFGGALNEVSPFAAHARIDPDNGGLVNFGVAYSGARTTLYVYEFEADGQRRARRRVVLDAPYTLHDFALTPHYAIFHLGPLLMDLSTLIGGGTLQDSLRFEPQRASRLLLVPRDKGAEPRMAETAPGYCLHFINAFEDDEALFVDLIEYERPLYGEYQPLPNLFQDVSYGKPARYRVDPETGATERQTIDSYDLAPDFPGIDPQLAGRRASEFWCLGMTAAGQRGRKFFDQLVRLDWTGRVPEICRLPAGEYFGAEPVYVSEPCGSAGAVIVQRFRPRDSETTFCVFDAHDLAAGPVAEIPLQSRICPSFHTAFQPEGRTQ